MPTKVSARLREEAFVEVAGAPIDPLDSRKTWSRLFVNVKGVGRVQVGRCRTHLVERVAEMLKDGIGVLVAR